LTFRTCPGRIEQEYRRLGRQLKAIFLDTGGDASARAHFLAYRRAMDKRLIDCPN
jgi:hypothetical protein